MTRDDIIRMAQEATNKNVLFGFFPQLDIRLLERFASLVAAAEREACAKVCDDYDVAEDVCSSDTAEGIAATIRARGQV